MSDQPAIRNAALDRMRRGDVALGMIVRLARSGDIARAAKTTGHDFIFVDTQHATFSLETVGHIVQAAMGCGIAPLIRVRSYEDPDIPRLLDGGAMGVVIPDIETAQQARRAVEACKFAPIGRRSVSAGYPAFDFRPVPLAQAVGAMNDATAVICMIETQRGLQNAEEIAAVQGVDVLHIGCNDLLADMGKPGAFGDPDVIEAIERVIDVCKRAGKFVGLGGDKDIVRQRRFIERGVQFVTTQSDLAFLMAEASRRVAELRRASP